jgi:hypothetical protein
MNCLGYATGQDDAIGPAEGASMQETMEELGYKCSGPTTGECYAKDDTEECFVLYIYSYENNPKNMDPFKDPWIPSSFPFRKNDYHAIRVGKKGGACRYVKKKAKKGSEDSKPKIVSPEPIDPDSYWDGKEGGVPKHRYCCCKCKK